MHWWLTLWSKPQAAAWERFDLALTVARYCRAITRFDLGSMSPPLMSELRQLEDRLGLNPLAMLRLRWDVTDDEVAEKRAERPGRARPKVVDPGAVAGS